MRLGTVGPLLKTGTAKASQTPKILAVFAVRERLLAGAALMDAGINNCHREKTPDLYWCKMHITQCQT